RLPDGLKREIIADLLNRANPEIVPEDLTTAHSFEFTESVEGSLLALRLSVLPTVNGPRLVIRIPQQPGGPANLVLEPTARGRLEELLQGDGLIVLASKRRTGRDQTLRALLASTDTCGRSIITIEQNSQPSLDDVVQLQIDRSSGLTCAAAMEAMEDQDADTIILAELRDPATALAAFDAAHDGALVVAGVNASSVDGVIDELLAMGIEPWPLGRTLKAIIVQATVRTLCEHCDGGCDRCSQSGWSGRTVLSGVVFVEGKLSELIRSGGTPEQFAQAIAQSDIGSLAHTARQAVDAGITTPDEIARILHRKFRCD
ncbi:MAG: Flp pilus assembly complex ATPase component, partial [bacterium]|nr:Flp pilus assembly complex ATPase component [bacterium]